MSTEVDNRIVAMQFDNKQFEAGTATSISTLDRLKKSLNLEGASKGLDGISESVKRVSFDGLSSGVEAVKVRFGALEVVAMTALSNITNSAMNAGKNLIKSLTIDPVIGGFKEYEEGLKAFQTILANTKSAGSTTDDINKALAVLNVYANQTIYSFGDMTKAIGLFTAQGVNLKDSITGIKGIFNLVSLTGGDADKANSAIYQLSQAVASGTVKAQDWISVVNAGIGGTDFQNQLKQTARVHGIAVDAMIKKTGSFKDSLTKGWLTSQVLLETLSQYTGDMGAEQLKAMGYTAKQITEIQELGKTANDSATKIKTYTQLMDTLKSNIVTGWATTFKTIIGSLDEASDVWTSVGNSIGGVMQASSDARNKLLSDWKILGGRVVLIDGLRIAFANLANIANAISSAFKEVFPATTYIQLYYFIQGLKELMEKLTMSKTQLTDVHKTFAGLFSILDIGIKIFEFFVRIIGDIALALLPAIAGIFSITAVIGDFFTKLNVAIEKSNIFRIVLNGIVAVISTVSKGIVYALTAVGKVFSQVGVAISPFVDQLKNFVKTSTLFADIINGISNVLVFALTAMGKGFEEVGKMLSPYITQLITFIKTSTLFADVMDTIKQAFSEAGKLIGPYIDKLKNFIQTSTLFSDILGTIKMVVIGAVTGIAPFVTIIKNVFGAVGTSLKELFTGSTVFADTLTGTKLGFSTATDGTTKFRDALDKVRDIMSKVGGAISTVVKTIKGILGPVFDFIKEKIKGLTMGDVGAVLTGTGLLIFAKALLKGLGSVDDIIKSFSKVLDQVGNTLKAFQLKVKAEALLKIAIAIGILAIALIALSFINMADLAKSLGALTIIFVELVGALLLINKYVDDVKKVTAQMVALGVGMLLLAFAVKILASIPITQLAQGTLAIAALMGIIAIFVKVTKGGDLKASAGGLAGFAVGIMVLTGALVILGKLKPETLIQGTLAIAGLMLTIGVFVKATKGGDLKASAGGLTAFAIGIAILTASLAILGKLKPETLIQGALAITALMSMIAVFIKVTSGGELATSAGGLVAFALGISILTASLAILGHMDTVKLIQGTLAIAALMGIIAIFIKITSGGDLKTSSAGIIGFAIGIAILTASLSTLGNMDTGKVIQGTLAIAALMLTIGLFVKVTKGGDLAASSAGMIGFAVGLTILTAAVAILAAIDPSRIIQGVVAIAALMLTIGLFVNLTKGGDLVASSGGMVTFAAGIMILAGTLALLSALNTTKLAVASAAVSALMVTIGLFVNLTKASDLLLSAVGLGAFSVAIHLLVGSLGDLTKLDPGALALSAGAVSVLLLSIAAFVNLTNAGTLIASSLGLVVFSGAILVLTIALKALGSMDAQSLIIAIGALAGVFLVIGVSALVLAPLTPIIMALSVAIALFGVGCLAVGAGLLLFANGLAILAKVGAPIGETFKAIVLAIVAMIPTIAKGIGDGLLAFIKVISEKAPIIWTAIVNLVTGMVNALIKQAPIFITGFVTLLLGILSAIIQYAPVILQKFLSLLLSLIQVVINNVPSFIKAGVDMIVAFVNGITQGLPRIIDAAFKMVIGFINGMADAIKNNAPAINSAVSNLITAIVDAISSFYTTLLDTGINVVQGIIDGVLSMASKLADALGSIVSGGVTWVKKLLGIHSPSKVFRDEVGVMIGQGMAEGIRDSSQDVVSAADKMSQGVVDAAKKWIDDRKFYNKISLEEELYVWQTIQAKYKEGDLARIEADKQVYTLKQEIIDKQKADDEKAIEDKQTADQASYDKSVATIDDLKFYNKMSQEQELASWKTIQSQYVEGSKQRIDADKQVYTLEKQMSDDLEAANKEHSDGILALDKDTNDKRKSLVDDYSASVLSIETKANEDRKTLLDDYYSKTQEINDKLVTDIASVNKTYDDAVASRTQTLYSSSGLFDEVTAPTTVTGDSLIKNLQDQTTQFATWQSNITGLSQKGLGDDLMKELTDMGPKSADQIAALNSMSSDELTTYVALWQTKHDEAKTESVNELVDLRAQTVTQIAQLNTDAATALATYTATWQTQTTAVTADATAQMSTLTLTLANNLVSLNADSAAQLVTLNATWNAKIAGLSTVTQDQFTTLKDNVGTTVTTLRTDTETEFTTLATNVQTIMAAPDWASIGANIVLGIKAGVTSKAADLAQEVARIALMALQAAKAALGIQSPSKEFAKVGAFAGQGLINGLSSYANKVASSASDLGTGALNSITNAISGISDIVTDNIDSDPVIRPVFDLSNIQNGSKQLYSMMSGLDGYAIDGSFSTANSTANNIQNNKNTMDDNANAKNTTVGKSDQTVSFVQNNYSPKALSRLDIYRQTKNQISALKGVVIPV